MPDFGRTSGLAVLAKRKRGGQAVTKKEDPLDSFLEAPVKRRRTTCIACNTPGLDKLTTRWLDLLLAGDKRAKGVVQFEEQVLRKIGYDARDTVSLRTHITRHMRRCWRTGKHLDE